MRDFGEAPPPPTFFERLKEGLSRTTAGLSDSITGIFTNRKLDAADDRGTGRSADPRRSRPRAAARLAERGATRTAQTRNLRRRIRALLAAEIAKVL